jgi:hypothetical protein
MTIALDRLGYPRARSEAFLSFRSSSTIKYELCVDASKGHTNNWDSGSPTYFGSQFCGKSEINLSLCTCPLEGFAGGGFLQEDLLGPLFIPILDLHIGLSHASVDDSHQTIPNMPRDNSWLTFLRATLDNSSTISDNFVAVLAPDSAAFVQNHSILRDGAFQTVILLLC